MKFLKATIKDIVSKMKNNISEKEVRIILKKYKLGEYKSHILFPKGVVQTNIKVKTTKGTFVLRKYVIRNLEYVKCEIDLLNYLHKKKFLSQLPYKAKNGEQYVLSNRKPVLLLNYIEGKHIDSNKISDNQLSDISKLLGKYHKLIKGFKPKFYNKNKLIKGFKPKFYNKRENNDAKYILSLFKEVRKNSKKLNKSMEVSLDIIKDRLNNIKFPKGLPKGFIHSDYHAGNILFDKGKISGVLDFDDGFYSYLIFDLADILDNYVFDRSNDFRKAKLIIKNYEKERKLTQIERNLLFDALRFRIMRKIFRIILFLTWHVGGYFKSLNANRGMVKNTRKLLRIEKIGKEEFDRKLK